METKFRKCKRNLAAALDQAVEDVPNCSSSSPNSVSSFHNCSLIRTSQDDTNEDFQCRMCPAKLQDLYTQRIDDLVAKLEFENELNRVYSRSSLSKNPDQGENTESANSDMDEGSTGHWALDSKEEYSFLLDIVLEIEQDNDFTADCDVSSLELDLHLSP